MQMTGNTILITGGASGIGLALARRFAARGNTVIVCGRRADKLAEAASAVAGLKTVRCDVSCQSERVELARSVTRDYPGLNVLINNAGIQNRPSSLLDPQDFSSHRAEIATNLEAPMHLAMLLLPHLAKKPIATIVNVTSGLAFVPLASMPTYCATKAALHSFTESLRHQLAATSVKVVELAPPAVDTDLGGPGLHTFGEPLDAFANHAFAMLERGNAEFGYKFAEVARTASAEARAQIFARMNAAH